MRYGGGRELSSIFQLCEKSCGNHVLRQIIVSVRIQLSNRWLVEKRNRPRAQPLRHAVLLWNRCLG